MSSTKVQNGGQRPAQTSGSGSNQAAQKQTQQQNAGLDSNFTIAQLNQNFKSDKLYYSSVTNKQSFSAMLSLMGKMPHAERDHVTKNLNAVINMNPKLLLNNDVLQNTVTLLNNVPHDTQMFTALSNNVLMKIRDFMIKNRQMLNLYEPTMMQFSENIRKFIALVTPKTKNDFFNSLDEQLLSFTTGKMTPEQKKKYAEQQKVHAKKKKSDLDDDEEEEGLGSSSKLPSLDMSQDDDEEGQHNHDQERIEQLLRIMFSDVVRLEPQLISAVVMSLVSQLPYGQFIIEDAKLSRTWLKSLNIE